MSITINLSEELTDTERRVLRAILEDTDPPIAPPKAPTRRAATKKAEPEPVEDDDTPNTEAVNDGPDIGDAVARATELVSAGKADLVKAALSKVGAKRVSELAKAVDIAAFLAALP